ncbi:hypothetical protein BH23CHL4_BH23CHL4_30040 [soil metagenome]
MNKKKTLYWIYGIGLFCLIYAIIRYHIFKGVSWEYFPLYILNKAISLTAVLLLAVSFLTRIFGHFSKLNKNSGIIFALVALVLAVVHATISGILLNPVTYPQIFSEGKINFMGQASLLLAVLAFLTMLSMGVITLFRKLNAKIPIEKTFFSFLKYGSLGLTGGHVVFLGFDSGIKPEEWPGYLLPITLVAFLAGLGTIIYRLFYRRKAVENPLSVKFINREKEWPKPQKVKKLM